MVPLFWGVTALPGADTVAVDLRLVGVAAAELVVGEVYPDAHVDWAAVDAFPDEHECFA